MTYFGDNFPPGVEPHDVGGEDPGEDCGECHGDGCSECNDTGAYVEEQDCDDEGE